MRLDSITQRWRVDRVETRGLKAGAFQHLEIREMKKGNQYVFGPLEIGKAAICVLCECSPSDIDYKGDSMIRWTRRPSVEASKPFSPDAPVIALWAPYKVAVVAEMEALPKHSIAFPSLRLTWMSSLLSSQPASIRDQCGASVQHLMAGWSHCTLPIVYREQFLLIRITFPACSDYARIKIFPLQNALFTAMVSHTTLLLTKELISQQMKCSNGYVGGIVVLPLTSPPRSSWPDIMVEWTFKDSVTALAGSQHTVRLWYCLPGYEFNQYVVKIQRSGNQGAKRSSHCTQLAIAEYFLRVPTTFGFTDTEALAPKEGIVTRR